MTAVIDRLTATGWQFMHCISRSAPPGVSIRLETPPNHETHESVIAALQPPVNPEVVSEYQNGTSRAL